MQKYITDKRTGIGYELIEDYYYPCIKCPTPPNIGKFGLLRYTYLKNHKSPIFSTLLMTDKLNEHLEEIDKSANEMFERIVSCMAQNEGITEQLKSENQMQWVGIMNNIKAAAEEIVLNELIYAD